MTQLTNVREEHASMEERGLFESAMRRLSNGEPDWSSPSAQWAWAAWREALSSHGVGEACARAAGAKGLMLTHVDIKNIESAADEYEALLARWTEASAGSQEVANLHATFQSRERALGRLAEGGLFRRIAQSLASPSEGAAGATEPTQEPVAWTQESWLADHSGRFVAKPHPSFPVPLYAHPAPAVAPREMVMLTEGDPVFVMVPTEAQSRRCDAVWSKYLERYGSGCLPSPHDAFRAAWFVALGEQDAFAAKNAATVKEPK